MSIRRSLTEELFTDPSSDRCVSTDLKFICCIFIVCLFFLMDTNSGLYFQSVQFNGTGVGDVVLLASPCCPDWYGRFILFYRVYSIYILF